VTTGAKPPQKVENQAALAASRLVLASPTVVDADLLDEVSCPVGETSLLDCAGEAGEAGLTGALTAGAPAEPLADELLPAALETTAGVETAAEDIGAADVFTVAVPLVELQPASSTAAPRAAIRLTRFM
jgi:hypothetical protein